MKVFQEAMIQSCVEVAVRETKRQYKIRRISAERNTTARITDDIALLNWIPHFVVKMEKANGAIWREILVS